VTANIPISDRRDMAIDEGTRVYVLVLRALVEELGVQGVNSLARTLGDVSVDNEQDLKVRDRLAEILLAATAHGAELGPQDDETDWIVERRWRDAMPVGARAYVLALRAVLESLGPAMTRTLATKMDEISVEGADVWSVRPLLGLPPKEGDGTIEDWVNFMGTGWTAIADSATDWEWVNVSASSCTLRVHRCPYFSVMPRELQATQPCEQGCSHYLDTAAQQVHPHLRLRGDPDAVTNGLGYTSSHPKGDAYCDLTVAFHDA